MAAICQATPHLGDVPRLQVVPKTISKSLSHCTSKTSLNIQCVLFTEFLQTVNCLSYQRYLQNCPIQNYSPLANKDEDHYEVEAIDDTVDVVVDSIGSKN